MTKEFGRERGVDSKSGKEYFKILAEKFNLPIEAGLPDLVSINPEFTDADLPEGSGDWQVKIKYGEPKKGAMTTQQWQGFVKNGGREFANPLSLLAKRENFLSKDLDEGRIAQVFTIWQSSRTEKIWVLLLRWDGKRYEAHIDQTAPDGEWGVEQNGNLGDYIPAFVEKSETED